jgi:hypothetical protein
VAANAGATINPRSKQKPITNLFIIRVVVRREFTVVGTSRRC